MHHDDAIDLETPTECADCKRGLFHGQTTMVRVVEKNQRDVPALSGTPDGVLTEYILASRVAGLKSARLVLVIGGSEGMDAAEFGDWFEVTLTPCAPPAKDVCPDWWFSR